MHPMVPRRTRPVRQTHSQQRVQWKKELHDRLLKLSTYQLSQAHDFFPLKHALKLARRPAKRK